MAANYPSHPHPDDVSIDTFFDADQLIQHDDVDSIDSHQSSGAHSPSSSRFSHLPNDFALDQNQSIHPAWPLAGQPLEEDAAPLHHSLNTAPFLPLSNGFSVKLELDDAGLPLHESMWTQQHQVQLQHHHQLSQAHHLHYEPDYYPHPVHDQSYPNQSSQGAQFDPYRSQAVAASGPTVAPTAVESAQSPFSTETSFSPHSSSLPTSPDMFAGTTSSTTSDHCVSASIAAASQRLQSATTESASANFQSVKKQQTTAAKKRKVDVVAGQTKIEEGADKTDKVKAEDVAGSDLSRSNFNGDRARSPSPPEVSTRPLPIIDTSATHSSLFVHPDTSGLSKRDARLVKNRAAAFLSRQRKREEFGEMERRCKALEGVLAGWWDLFGKWDDGAQQASELAVTLGEESVSAVEFMLNNGGADVASFLESVSAVNETSAGRKVAPLPSAGAQAVPGQKRTRDSSVTPSQRAELTMVKDENNKLRSELENAQKLSAHLAAELKLVRQMEEAEKLKCVTHSLSSASMTPHGQGPFLSGVSNRPSQFRSQLSFALPPSHGVKSNELGEADGPYRTSFSEDSDMIFNPVAMPFMVPDDLEGAGGQYGSAASTATHSRNSSISTNTTSPSSSSGHLVSTAAGHPKKAAGGMALMAILFSFALFGMPAGTGNTAKGIEIGRADIANDNLVSLGRAITSLSSGTTLRPSTQTRRKRRAARIAASQSKSLPDDQASISDEEMYDAEEGLDEDLGASTPAPSSHLSEADLDVNVAEELSGSAKQQQKKVDARSDSATNVLRWWEQTLLAAAAAAAQRGDTHAQDGTPITAATAEFDVENAALLDVLDLSSIGRGKESTGSKGSSNSAASIEREQMSRDLSTYLGDSLRLLSIKRGPVSDNVDQSKTAAFILVGAPYEGESHQDKQGSDSVSSTGSGTSTTEATESTPSRFTLFLPTPSQGDNEEVTEPSSPVAKRQNLKATASKRRGDRRKTEDSPMGAEDSKPTVPTKLDSDSSTTASQPASQRISSVKPTGELLPPHLRGEFLQLEFSLDAEHMWHGQQMHELLRNFATK